MGVANLAWDASSGGNSAVAGYKVSYGPSSGAYAKTIDVGNSTSCSIRDLAQGTYYFAVSAYDSSGTESGYSNEVSKTIR